MLRQAPLQANTTKMRVNTRAPDRWASGAMDNASDYGSEDSRFDSWLARSASFASLSAYSSFISLFY